MLDDADAYVQLTEEAVQWYQKSAEGGYAAAQHHMGLCHAKGDGVEQNWTQAARWFGLAAAQVRPGDVPLFPSRIFFFLPYPGHFSQSRTLPKKLSVVCNMLVCHNWLNVRHP